MRLPALIIMSLAWGTTLAATVYKWVDGNGVTHYSDQPYPGAKKLEVGSAQTYSAPPPPAVAAARSSATPATAGPIYKECELYRPANDEVFFNTSTVEAKLRLDPRLRAGDKVAIALDGKRMSDLPMANGVVALSPVERGTHTILVVVEDSEGKPVCQSPAVSFHVRQASRLSPQSPTAPPKPPPGTPKPTRP